MKINTVDFITSNSTTRLIKKGVYINYVKEIVGHSQISTTMGYIHIVTKDLREAVEKISVD